MTKDRPWLNEVVDIIATAIEDAAAAQDGSSEAVYLSCIDVEWLAGPETLRVYIDRLAQEGENPEEVPHITVDDCAIVNKILFDCPALDQKINTPYNLEVSSLGLEPPLRLPHHFRSYIGDTVKVKLSEPIEGRKSVKGQLTAVTDSDISLAPTAAEGEVLTIPLVVILKARAAYAY